MDLRLVPFSPNDEEEVLAGHQAMIDNGEGGLLLFYDPRQPWSDWVESQARHRRGLDIPPRFVRSVQLKTTVAGRFVGRVSIRFELNDRLLSFGGHIGYYLLPGHRGLGYGTEMLRQSLVVARSEGVDRVLVICDDDNLASARVAEKCGGVLEGVTLYEDGETPIRRYWID